MGRDQREYWDEQAALYAASEGEGGLGRFLALYEETCWRYIEAVLPPPGEGLILEAGCGIGRWVVRLTPLGYRVVLADLSPEMIRHARARMERLGLSDRVAAYHVLDICDMRAPPEASFGLVLALGGPLSLCRDARQAAGELGRVTRPGGYVVCDAASRYRSALDLLHGNDLGPLCTLLETGQCLHPDGLSDHRFTPQELAGLFEDAGLRVMHLAVVCPFFAYLPAAEEPCLLDDERLYALMRHIGEGQAEDAPLLGLSGRLLAVARIQRPTLTDAPVRSTFSLDTCTRGSRDHAEASRHRGDQREATRAAPSTE